MLTRFSHAGITWVDLESPTHAEAMLVMEEFRLDRFIAEELLFPTVKPRLERHSHYLYIVLHFPTTRHTHKTKDQEVDFVVGRDFIITTRYDIVDPLHLFSRVFEVNSHTDKASLGDHPGFIFYYMMKRMYKATEHEHVVVRGALDEIEQQIFSGHERAMVTALSGAGRDLVDLRQAVEPHRDILHELEREGSLFFGDAFAPFLRGLTNENHRVYSHITRLTETLRELRETNNSLLTAKQNDIMKTLTIMAFATLPLSLIATLFGMNTAHTPLVGHAYDFWAVIAIMGVAAVCMFAYFRSQKWW
ncbi:MAG: CorA family divalent cation transporter [Patescibacteria group bacterium]